jgi:hypothetical protein
MAYIVNISIRNFSTLILILLIIRAVTSRKKSSNKTNTSMLITGETAARKITPTRGARHMDFVISFVSAREMVIPAVICRITGSIPRV